MTGAAAGSRRRPDMASLSLVAAGLAASGAAAIRNVVFTTACAGYLHAVNAVTGGLLTSSWRQT